MSFDRLNREGENTDQAYIKHTPRKYKIILNFDVIDWLMFNATFNI